VAKEDDEHASLTSMTPEAVAALLSKAGSGPVTAAEVRADIKAGAPTDEQGRIHLLNYAAWLLKDVQAKGCG
jgi:hypothetical protein